MKIVAIRHGTVDYIWSRWCTSEEFDKECAEYDKAPIKHTAYNIPAIGSDNVFISSLPRSRATAENLFDCGLRQTEWADEVPLRSSFDTKFKLPLWFWNLSGRLQWLINSSRQPEGRLRTQERAGKIVDLLCREGTDGVIVTHGFFMLTLLQEMKHAGFTISKTHAKYQNGEYVIAEKNGHINMKKK